MISKLIRARRRFSNANDGISAVEFALIAPLMAIIYCGSIELSFMMTLDRKVTAATATLGDLTARASAIDNDDLSDIFQATRMVIQPNDITRAHMRVTSLEDSGTATQPEVAWSDKCGTAFSDLVAGATVTIPDNLIPSGGTLIMAEIEYPYNSPIGFMFPNEKPLTDTFYLRPRRVDAISRDTTGGSTSCGAFTPPVP
ncbi:MAG: TadE/TadG family type IV pilus assembly protein [Pseudomonadota bacterium]